MIHSETLKEGRIIPPLELSGPKQMAIDVMLLENSIKDSDIHPSFRVYTWKGNWISLGKNQEYMPKRWKSLANKGLIKFVKRPSGGNAVLHSGGITYALVLPSPPRKKREAYLKASQFLIKSFMKLGITLKFGSQPPNQLKSNCFATSTNADLIDKNGNKVIGSSQLWRKGHLLQHGEILINPPQELWMNLFGEKPPKNNFGNISNKALIEVLHQSLFSCWPEVKWKEQGLRKKELGEITIEAPKYLFDFH